VSRTHSTKVNAGSMCTCCGAARQHTICAATAAYAEIIASGECDPHIGSGACLRVVVLPSCITSSFFLDWHMQRDSRKENPIAFRAAALQVQHMQRDSRTENAIAYKKSVNVWMAPFPPAGCHPAMQCALQLQHMQREVHTEKSIS
jgi:hypothetical protein